MEAVKTGSLKFSRNIIPEETLQEILLNISQIYDFDCEFLKALEDRMESWYTFRFFFFFFFMM